MKENGWGQIDMGLAFSIGPMELNMKGTGRKIKPVEKESFLMPIVTHIKGNGKTIKQMDSVSTCT